VDLDRLTNAEVDAMFEAFKGTDAIIMDMRGYPRETAWSIAPRLTEKREPVAALFRRNLVRADNPAGSEIGTLFFEQRLPATDVVEGISFPSACCFPGLFRKPGKQLLAPRFGVNTVGSAGGRSSTWI
jgi:hypothetical protein